MNMPVRVTIKHWDRIGLRRYKSLGYQTISCKLVENVNVKLSFPGKAMEMVRVMELKQQGEDT